MKCIICKGEVIQFSQSSYMGLPTYLCKNCQLYVTGNSEFEIRQKSDLLYKEEYWTRLKSEESLLSNFKNIDSQGKRRQWISQYSYTKKYLENKSNILEIGSGAGQTIYWFDQIGFSVTGIEPDARNVELINKKLTKSKCQAGFFEDINIEKKFDVIWMSHVFEHLVRPDLLLEKLQRGLNDDGVIFIEVPNCENQIIRDLSIDKNPSTYHRSEEHTSELQSH